jgi:hypothetical protein
MCFYNGSVTLARFVVRFSTFSKTFPTALPMRNNLLNTARRAGIEE